MFDIFFDKVISFCESNGFKTFFFFNESPLDQVLRKTIIWSDELFAMIIDKKSASSIDLTIITVQLKQLVHRFEPDFANYGSDFLVLFIDSSLLRITFIIWIHFSHHFSPFKTWRNISWIGLFLFLIDSINSVRVARFSLRVSDSRSSRKRYSKILCKRTRSEFRGQALILAQIR